MKAAVCYEFGKPLVIDEVEITPPGKDEVLVRMGATAICHSDIHIIRGDMDDGQEKVVENPDPGKPALTKPPFVAGHESAGYIEEIGENVSTVKQGDTVIASLLRSCGECNFCARGMPHFCPVLKNDTVSPIKNKKGQPIARMERIASFAEYALLHKSQVVKIPQDMPMAQASLMACGVITGFGAVVFRAQVKPLSSVVVIGTGGVGLNSIQGAAFVGAHPVIAVDVSDLKLEASREFGATHTVNAKEEDPVEAVKKITNRIGADYVFITVGSTDAMQQGFAMLANRGMAVNIGAPPLMNSFLNYLAYDFIGSERSVTGAYMGSTNFKVHIPKLIELYQAGRLKLDELITHRFALDEINEAIEEVEKGVALRNIIMF